jgi:hypothetical protein
MKLEHFSTQEIIECQRKYLAKAEEELKSCKGQKEAINILPLMQEIQMFKETIQFFEMLIAAAKGK